MSIDVLQTLKQEVDRLTADEQLQLAAYLVEKVRSQPPSSGPLRWRDLRGMAKPSLLGEDAQAWVSRTRLESDEQRERGLRGQP